MIASDVLEIIEPELASAKAVAAQATSALGPMLEEGRKWFAEADRDTQIVAALAAGLLLGKAVSRLGR